MSWKEIVAAIGGIGAIVGGVVYLFKWATWKFQKTPIEKEQEISNTVNEDEQRFRDTGRP